MIKICSVVWRPATGAVLAASLLVAGCGREEVSVTRVPKDSAAGNAAPAGHAGMGMSAGAGAGAGALPAGHPTVGQPSELPEPHWTAPAGWEETAASGMSVARYKVPGKEGKDADVSVMVFPGGAGHDLDVVNIFRERLKLPALDEAGLKGIGRAVNIGAEAGQLYDMEAPASGTNAASRLLVAILPQSQVSWYFRMIGASETVAAHVEPFDAFLKSTRFEMAAGAGAPAAASAPAAPATPIPPLASVPSKPEAAASAAGGGGIQAEVPSGWSVEAPTPMVTARYSVAGEGGKAEVTVSSFPGDVGGLVANINRWRGQIGLDSVGDSEARALAKPVQVQGVEASLVDLEGTKAGKKVRLTGLIVPRGDRTWFYKMLGDEAVTGREKDNLVKFAQSAKVP